jgi:glycerol-3-phosphate acyltransferase PlsY
MLAATVIIGGYLLGSIPSAYLAGRWLKGIDLREYGSTTVSGSAVFQHVSFWAGIAVGLFDIAKGTLPAWIALHFELGLPLALAAGTAAIMGHNWPLYLGFKGGRGIGTSMGMLLVVFPWGIFWLLLFLAIGHLIKWGALAALAGMATLPVLPWFLPTLTEHPIEVTWAALAILLPPPPLGP